MSTSTQMIKGVELIKDLYDKLAPFRESLKTGQELISKSLDRASESINNPGNFSSDNEDINKIRSFAVIYNKELSALARKDDNFWIEWSGVNVLNQSTIDTSVKKLNDLTNTLNSISNAIPAMITLVAAGEATNGWANKLMYAFSPSLDIMEALAVKQAIEELKTVQDNVENVTPKISSAMEVISKQKV